MKKYKSATLKMAQIGAYADEQYL